MLRIRSLAKGVLQSSDMLTEESMRLEPGVKLWIDVEAPQPDIMQTLKARFGLHPLAVEDCFHVDLRPKLDEYGTHQFIVFQSFTGQATDGALALHEMHMFLGADWLITVHVNPHPALGELCRRLESDVAATLGRGVDHLAFMLTDMFIGGNFPIVDALNDELEAIEDALFGESNSSTMEKVFELKRQLVHMRRVLAPQREVVNQLSLRGIPEISERAALYFRRSGEQLMRLAEQVESAKESLSNVMEAHRSMVANRSNEVTKQLTLFASIFMPLSFIVGFFGQNFEVFSAPVFMNAMLVMVVLVPILMAYVFYRRKWL